tara:strand:+ start:10849 stop:11061 length:213 start_codon:yes stop_codon:yes gene_type:complete
MNMPEEIHDIKGKLESVSFKHSATKIKFNLLLFILICLVMYNIRVNFTKPGTIESFAVLSICMLIAYSMN